MNDIQEKQITRQDILSVEELIKNTPGAMLGDCLPLKHLFSDGLYIREIFIPKGMLLVGKIHRKSNPVFIMSGDISIFSEEGNKRFKAPYYMVSNPGAKRVGYAHEDTVWVEVFASKETDLDKLEKELIVNSYEELEFDYKNFISEVSK